VIFSVCPHDIVKQMQIWLEMSAYLSAQLGQPIQLRQAMDFQEFYQGLAETDLVFANPMDAWLLHKEHGFLPLSRTELYDEVVFFTAAEAPAATLEDLAGQPVGAVERQFATALGLYLLREKGIEPGAVRYYDSWIQVIRGVAQGDVPYGMLYQDFFTELSSLSRSMIRVIHESRTGYATHIFLVNPRQEALVPSLRDVLVGMHEDPQGQRLLQSLRLGRWVPTEDLGMIPRILEGVS